VKEHTTCALATFQHKRLFGDDGVKDVWALEKSYGQWGNGTVRNNGWSMLTMVDLASTLIYGVLTMLINVCRDEFGFCRKFIHLGICFT
jgi:hypothetical protein